jgi:hypothetical protein
MATAQRAGEGADVGIVYYQLFRRKPELSPSEFNQKFASYARHLTRLTQGLGEIKLDFAREWGQRVNDSIALARGAARPFDGVVRMTIPDPADFMRRIGAGDPTRLNDELATAQAEFADMRESVYGFSEAFDPNAS